MAETRKDAGAGRAPRSSVNLARSVAEQIESMIARGLLVPGQRLVEGDLEKQLQVSRMPIREALRLLAGDGLVEIVPNRGARVRSMTPRQIGDMLKVLVGLLFVALDDFPTLPDHAANIHSLQAIVDRMEEHLVAHDKYAIIASAGEFEMELVRLTGNQYLFNSIKRVHFQHYSRQFCRFFSFQDIANIGLGYLEIIRWLEDKRIDLVKDKLTSSLHYTVKTLYGISGDHFLSSVVFE